MVGASRLIVSIYSPFHRVSDLGLTGIPGAALSGARGRRVLFPSRSRHQLGFCIRSGENVHKQSVPAISGEGDGAVVYARAGCRGAQQWPEWTRFVDFVVGEGFSDCRSPAEDDEGLFWNEGELGENFVKVTECCIRFARERSELLRSLTRKDIQILVETDLPLIFKNGGSSTRRLRSFLNENEANELQTEVAGTVDLMRYLLSCVWYSWSNQEESYFQSKEIIETTCRKLLSDLVIASCSTSESRPIKLASRQTLLKHEQFSRPPGQNIKMKRGDWICPKCSFMNFATNMRCLECNEARPKRVLTGGEWECPQCDFYNYGRNMSCLRCDCRRPTESRQSTLDSQGSSSSGRSSTVEQILSRSSVNNQSQPGGSSLSSESISQSLDKILGRTSASSGSNNPVASGGRDIGSETKIVASDVASQRRDPDYVSFVPLPSDMFRKPGTEVNEQSLKNEDFVSVRDDKLSEPGFNSFESTTQNKNDNGSSNNAERWSNKVSDSENITDQPSAKANDNFPDMMPMRKGENRFVISKKKDRSLTSPQYKRRLAMEQANNSNFVPFVPFPPGYFAKKDKEPETSTLPASTSARPASPAKSTDRIEKIEEFKTNANIGAVTDSARQFNVNTTSQLNFDNSNSNSMRKKINEPKDRACSDGAAGNSLGLPIHSEYNQSQSWNNMQSQSSDTASTSAEPQQNQSSSSSRESWKSTFPGKSLEGSAVSKEPDPLDMSEEAKAQRWFRRVAQIKDISELANIPDEDFPKIMPMRKGVNRFVVSKRKTPLERRLTSQYQKDLPISTSIPDKDSPTEKHEER